ncbi:MAG: hypothetical protein ABJB76_01110 [Candidatus Nitrosocosmicus sp.]
MSFTKDESLKLRNILLDKDNLQIIFDGLRNKLGEIDTIIKSINTETLNPTDKNIVRTRLDTFNEFKILVGLLEVTLFNVAEQNERLTKLIQTNSSNEPQTTMNELLEKVNTQQKEIADLKNDPNKIWLDRLIEISSATTDE